MLFGPVATDDRLVTIASSGRHVLLLEGRVSEGTAVNYSFVVASTAQANPGNATTQDFAAAGLPYTASTFGSNTGPVVVRAGAFPSALTANNTGAAAAVFLDAPDDEYLGLGNGTVTYDLGDYRVSDGVGGDFNVYEVDSGGAEFAELRVEVSADGINYSDITPSSAARIAIAGDEGHGNAAFGRSYSLSGTGLAQARYIRLTGTSTSAPGGTNGFDLDAIGLVNFSRADGGAADSFLRLLPGHTTGTNTVGFVSTAPGVTPSAVTVEFDLRITRVSNQGDGIGFAWLNPLQWGHSGPAPRFGEEPNLAGSFGVGFDPVANSEVSDNHVSLHFDGAEIAEFNLAGFRLDSGAFHHARIVMTAVAGGSNVSVYLRPAGASEVAVVENYFVSGMQAYDGRVALGARNGGFRAHNDIDNLSVNVTAGTPEALPEIRFGETVSTTLGSASERDRYTFTLTEAKRVYFDSLTVNVAGADSFNLRWYLTGTDGTSYAADRPFRQSDSADGTSIFDLAAGTYTLTVQGVNSISGPYSFRLLDLGAAATLVPGTVVSATLNPANETDSYRFGVTAGERFYFDITARSGGDVRWRLLDPFGRAVFGPADFNHPSYDVGTLTLAQTGNYTLLVEGRYNRSDPTSYGLVVNKVVDSTAALELDRAVTATIAKGQTQNYTFSLASDVRAYFDSLTTSVASSDSFYLRWSLEGPRGTLVADRPFRQSDASDGTSILDLVAGDYTLAVWSTNEIAGEYRFRLADLAKATAIVPGDLVEATLAPANETDAYRFDAAAGDRFYFDRVAQSGGDIRWRLLDPFGRTVFGPIHFGSESQIGVRTLELAGSYTLLVEGRYYVEGEAGYSFRVQPVVDETIALTLGELQSQSLATQGQVDTYTFTLTEAKRVYFDSQPVNVSGSDSYYLRWALSGPRGVLASDVAFREADSYDGLYVFDLVPGDYALTVRGSNDIAGDYRFRLLDLGAAPLIETGAPISGVLNPANETDAYRFNAKAGDRYFFDRTANSGGDTHWRLLDPFGRTVWGPLYMPSSDVDVTTLAFDGVYTLLIEGRYYVGGTDSYAFSVSPSPIAERIVIGGLGSGQGPDLTVENITVSPVGGTLAAGGRAVVSWQVFNRGTEPANAPWSDRLLVRNLDRGTTIVNVLVNYDDLGEGADDPLAPGASRTRQTTITLPAGAAGSGNLRFEVSTDVTNVVAEPGTAELNNLGSASQLAELTPYPDLQVSNLAVDPAGAWVAGQNVTLRWRTNNAGDAPVNAAWSDRVLVRNLSTGATIAEADIRYDPAAPEAGALAGGGFRDRSFTFVWPAGPVGGGRFEFQVTSDAGTEIFESNAADDAETNNAARIAVVSAPDLVVGNLAVTPLSPSAGARIAISWTTTNSGAARTPAGWNDRVVVFRRDTGERLLDTVLAYDPAAGGNAPLGAGEGIARSYEFRLPDGARGAGDLEVQVTADQNTSGHGLLAEFTAAGASGEGNNGSALQFTSTASLYANLVASGLTAPAGGRGGDIVTIGWRVDNLGGAATPTAWTDRLVLSADNVFGNADDRLLADVAHSGVLQPTGSYLVSHDVTLPLFVQGNYFLMVRSDVGEAVLEPDTRADNTTAPRAFAMSTPAADLAVEVVSAPASAQSGDSIDVLWRVRNQGDFAASGGWRDAVYLSEDGSFDAADRLLGTFFREGPVPVGEAYSARGRVVLPFEVNGNFRLIVVADFDNTVFESGLASNNIGVAVGSTAVSAAPAPDLETSAVSAPATAPAGELVTVSWTLANRGEAQASSPWVDRIYLSADGNVAGATLLGSFTHTAPLVVNQAQTFSAALRLPAVADGNYRLIVVSDVDNQVYEARREANNTAPGAATLAVQHRDLTHTAFSAPAAAVSGSVVRIERAVTNTGSASVSGSWVDRFYLSRNATVDTGDRLLAEIPAGGDMAAGASYGGPLDLTIPVDVSGAWFILAVADARNDVAEVNAENNNVAALAIEVTLAPYADLAVTDVTAPTRLIADPARITVGWTVTNSGTGVGQTLRGPTASCCRPTRFSATATTGCSRPSSTTVRSRSGPRTAAAKRSSRPPRSPAHSRSSCARCAGRGLRERQRSQQRRCGARAARRDADSVRRPSRRGADAPTAGRSGTPLTVTWTVRNDGIGPTDTESLVRHPAARPRCGRHAIITSVGVDHFGVLEVGGSTRAPPASRFPTAIRVRSTPWSVPAGRSSSSHDDNNGLVSGPVEIALAPAPDLRVTEITAPPRPTKVPPSKSPGRSRTTARRAPKALARRRHAAQVRPDAGTRGDARIVRVQRRVGSRPELHAHRALPPAGEDRGRVADRRHAPTSATRSTKVPRPRPTTRSATTSRSSCR